MIRTWAQLLCLFCSSVALIGPPAAFAQRATISASQGQPAREDGGQAPDLSQAANTPALPAQTGPNAMTRAAVERGILQCASRVEQVTKFLGFGPKAGGLLLAPAAPVDERLFAMQMEVPAGASGNSFVDLNFAPGQANGCGATYQAVSYWSLSCDALASGQFAGLRRLGPIQREIAVLDGGPATKVFLMKAGDKGCISIKKEVVL